MPYPVRNWRNPYLELHPDLKKEIDFLRRGDEDGDHWCKIHPDIIERYNAHLFNAHQLEAFAQAVEDVKIELNMNFIIDGGSILTKDGRPYLVVQLVPADWTCGTLPEDYPGQEAETEAGELTQIVMPKKKRKRLQ